MNCVVCAVGGDDDGDDMVRLALGLLDHVKTIRLSKEVGGMACHGAVCLKL